MPWRPRHIRPASLPDDSSSGPDRRLRGQSAGRGSGRDFDEPDGDFDRECRMRRMRYLMRKAQAVAADNDALEADRLDIISALAVARDSCRDDDIEQCELFVHSVSALARFLGFRSALDERVRWGEAALAVAERRHDDLAIAELSASTIAWPLLQQGRHDEARRYCIKGLEAARRCTDTTAAARWSGYAARTLSGIARDNQDGPNAGYWAEQAAAYARQCNDQSLLRGAELDFGYAALLRGDFAGAEKRFRALLELEEQGEDDERIGNRSGDVAHAIMNRAIRSENSTDKAQLCEEARVLVQHGLRLGRKISHMVMIGEGEISLGVLAHIRGDEDTYHHLVDSGRRRFAKLGIQRPGRAEQFVFSPPGGMTAPESR